MTQFPEALERIDNDQGKVLQVADILSAAHDAGYTEVDVDTNKPWGAYIRFDDDNVANFIDDFFPGLTVEDARLGVEDAPLSPKILLVSPAQRLSLQIHERRAERWKFLTAGDYYRGAADELGEIYHAKAGDIVQFQSGDLHRLCGLSDDIVLVAEIWQHTDPDHLSDESDIERLEDDYAR